MAGGTADDPADDQASDAPASASSPTNPSSPSPRAARWPSIAAVVGLTIVGAVARVDGLTRLGLWRDDAWVGLSAAVGPRTAVRMSATSPGFTLLERAWLQLGAPTTSWWGQLPPLGLGIAAVPATYLLLRAHRVTERLALAGAALVMASPIAITYATRLKPYGLDLLAAVAVLWLGERARQHPSHRELGTLAAASIGLLAMSGSTAPVIAGTWAALLLGHLPAAGAGRRTCRWGAVAGIGCGAVFLAFFRGLPPGLSSVWHDHYLAPASVAEARTILPRAAARFLHGLVPASLEDHRALAVVLLAVVVGSGLAAGRRAWAPALTLLAAILAAALELAPIGTGRTDEVLYPAVVLLAALGAQAGWAAASARLPSAVVIAASRRTRAVVATTALAVAAVPLVLSAAQREVAYPGTDLARLAATIDEHRIPGDVVVVEARTRYLWGLTQQDVPALRFGDRWLTGFTLGSDDPGTFVQGSYPTEPGYTPKRWADQLAGATQLLYLSTPFDADPPRPDRAFQALLADGWREVEAFDATGGRLVILRRPSSSPAG